MNNLLNDGLCCLCTSPKQVGYLLVLVLSGSVLCGSSVPLRVVGPDGPLWAVVGQDLVLPCSFTPGDGAQQVTVVWYRISDDSQAHIHMHSDGTDQNEDQSEDYRGRTSLFLDEISAGNVSLKLSGVRLSDAGSYQCTVDAGDGNHDNADMEVQVKDEDEDWEEKPGGFHLYTTLGIVFTAVSTVAAVVMRLRGGEGLREGGARALVGFVRRHTQRNARTTGGVISGQ